MAKRERRLQTDDNLAMLENADIVCSVSSDDSCDDEPISGGGRGGAGGSRAPPIMT